DPGLVLGKELLRTGWTRGGAQLFRDGPTEVEDAAGSQAQVVVGGATGDGRRTLDPIRAIHGTRNFSHRAPAHEIARPAIRSRARSEEVRIQREHYIGHIQPVLDFEWLTEGEFRAGVYVVTVDRLVLVPASLRQEAHQCGQLGREGGRRDGFGEN